PARPPAGDRTAPLAERAGAVATAFAARRSRRPQVCARPCHHPGGRDRHRRGAASSPLRPPGAGRLAALGPARAGAGLVTIATPPAALAVYQSAEPGNLVTVCEDGNA